MVLAFTKIIKKRCKCILTIEQIKYSELTKSNNTDIIIFIYNLLKRWWSLSIKKSELTKSNDSYIISNIYALSKS